MWKTWLCCTDMGVQKTKLVRVWDTHLREMQRPHCDGCLQLQWRGHFPRALILIVTAIYFTGLLFKASPGKSFGFCPGYEVLIFLAWFSFKIPESGFNWFSESLAVLWGHRLLAGLWMGRLWIRPLASSHSCSSASSTTWWRENPVCQEPHWRGLCLQSIWGGFLEECNRKVSSLPGQAHAIGQVSSKVGKWTPGHLLGRFRPEQTEPQGMCEESLRAKLHHSVECGISPSQDALKPQPHQPLSPRGLYHSVCHISFFPFLVKRVDERKPDMNLPQSQFRREVSFSVCVLPCWHLWALPAGFITAPGPGSRMTRWQVWGEGPTANLCAHETYYLWTSSHRAGCLEAIICRRKCHKNSLHSEAFPDSRVDDQGPAEDLLTTGIPESNTFKMWPFNQVNWMPYSCLLD